MMTKALTVSIICDGCSGTGHPQAEARGLVCLHPAWPIFRALVLALSNIRDGVAHFDPLSENSAEHRHRRRWPRG
jgi:hypothetical protein